MAKDLAVAVIHGMGAQRPDFADEMIAELADRVGGSDRIAWQSIYWADLLQSIEIDYLNRANATNDLDFMGLRRFVVGALGDAVAYRRMSDDPNDTYGRIHRRVRDALLALRNDPDKLDGHDRPLVILAHSLGGHIVSNYVWDIQHNDPIVAPGSNPFERIETLRGIVTFGCNIPVFTFALDDVVPIALPDGARWFNYFDPDDVLGYPLRALNVAYANTVSADVPISVGGFLTSWNPLSHLDYWTDDDLTRPVARFIGGLLGDPAPD